MIKCVVIDDEAGAIDILTNYINDTPGLEITASFRDPVEAWQFLTSSDIDLAFVDIDMPALDGLQLADLLKPNSTSVIFCTAYTEFAARSYELEVLDYLLKPIPFDRFLKAVEKYKSSIPLENAAATDPQPSETLFVKSGATLHRLSIDEIKYIKKDGHYVEFHLEKSQLLSRMNMDELLTSLPTSRFARIHKSYVVGLEHIQKIEKQFVNIGGRELPIGDHYRKTFFNTIQHAGN